MRHTRAAMSRLLVAALATQVVDCSGGSEPAPESGSRPAVSAAKEGSELIGKPAPGWALERWFNSQPLALADLRGKVVLVRWFMSPECPFCSATAPALNQLDDRYRGRGLVVLGFYHHKRAEPLDPDAVRGYLEHFEFRFPVAIDPDWTTLRRWWLDRERSWTSVSFLLDKKGIIRFIHPGGKYAPGSPEMAEIEEQIEGLLTE